MDTQQAAVTVPITTQDTPWPQEFARDIATQCEEALLKWLSQQNAPAEVFSLLYGMEFFSLYRTQSEYFDNMHKDFPDFLKEAMVAIENLRSAAPPSH
ncbi:MAG: hypothetical protein KF698_08335 [Anaerolineales bacterium]|nr:hypothetical protein [Anaerolineales bacterium]